MAQAIGKQRNRTIIRATERIVSSSGKPLRTGARLKPALIWPVVLTLGAGILLQQNFQAVAGFINRPIVKVRIENQWQRISEAEVGNMLAPYLGAGFFSFDVAAVRQRLERHPWVDRASIRKSWPDTLALDLREKVAIARWGQSQLLNQKGVIFEPPAARNLTGLPALSGPADSHVLVMEQFQIISQLLFPSGLRLTGLTLSPRGSWDLQLNDSMEVAAGRTDVINRLKRFVQFYRARPPAQTASIESVDLRYDNGIAVKTAPEEPAGVALR